MDTPYRSIQPDSPLEQGDILDGVPLVFWSLDEKADPLGQRESVEATARVVVLTQSCDLANQKTTRIQVAVVHEAQALVDTGIIRASLIRDQISRHRVYGWYFLPAGDDFPESIVSLHDLHTVPRPMLEQLVKDGKRVVSLGTPYREHLAQQFSLTYARIALRYSL